jgi:DNA-binding MarR family transcriptional regulator
MEHTQWLDEEERRAWMAFIGASSMVNRALDQQLKEDSGLTHIQYGILVRLNAARGGTMRMNDLVSGLLTSKSGLSYQIGQLEKAGLVTRRTCEWDPRGVLAELTDAGREMLERAAPGHVAKVREVLIDVLTPEQRKAVADGLGAVRDRLVEAEYGDWPDRS